MLTLENVSSGYGPLKVLDGVSIQVHQGEIVTVIGANGAGKTTLLRTISGLIRVQQGNIVFRDSNIANKGTGWIVQAGLVQVPEGRLIISPLSVYDNLLLGTYAVRKRMSKADVQNRLEFVYQLFPRLFERRNQKSGTLSGGEQQMLALGRALMSKPHLLLLDEPSLGLSPVMTDLIFDALKKLNSEGYSMLLVEQNVMTALNVASRGYVIERGEITISGSTQELMNDPRVKEAYLS